MTAQTLITEAYQVLGAVGQGETPSPEQLAAGLAALNELAESWSTQKAFIASLATAIYPLSTGVQTYTLGTAGTFTTTRPIKIEEIVLLLVDPGATATGKLRFPIKMITYEEWAALTPKTDAGTTPTHVYNDYGNPVMTLSFWPIPTFTTNTPSVELFTWVSVPSFATLSTVVTLWPGYQRALKYALAVDLLPEAGVPAQANAQFVTAMAQQSMQAIQTLNQQLEQPTFDRPAPVPPNPMATPAVTVPAA